MPTTAKVAAATVESAVITMYAVCEVIPGSPTWLRRLPRKGPISVTPSMAMQA